MGDRFNEDPNFRPTGRGGWIVVEEPRPEEVEPVEEEEEDPEEDYPDEEHPEEQDVNIMELEEDEVEQEEAIDWDAIDFGENDPMGSEDEESELGDGEVIDDPHMLREKDLPTGVEAPIYRNGVDGPLWTPWEERRIPIMVPYPSMQPVRVTPYQFHPRSSQMNPPPNDPYFPTSRFNPGPYSTYEVGQSSRSTGKAPLYPSPTQVLSRQESERIDVLEAHKDKLQRQMKEVIKHLNMACAGLNELDRDHEKEVQERQRIREEVTRQEVRIDHLLRETTVEVQYLRNRATQSEDRLNGLSSRVLSLEDPGSPISEEDPDTSPSSSS